MYRRGTGTYVYNMHSRILTHITHLHIHAQPKLLSFRDNQGELAIAAKGQQYIGLRFASRRAGGSTQVLVFINDENDRTEECLCVSIQYQ